MAIDVHGHLTPLALMRHLEGRAGYPRAERSQGRYTLHASPLSSFPLAGAHHDLDQRRAELDRLGIERQLVCLSAAYGYDRLRGAEAVDVAGAVNAALREAASIDRQRYATLAVAPVETENGREVLEQALAAGHHGMILSGSTITHLESVEPLLPLLETLHTRAGILFVHPGSFPELAGVLPTRFGVSGVAFQNELTAALLRLLEWDVLTRFAGLKLLFCNLGGTVPLLIERWQHMGGEAILPLLGQITYDCSSFGPRGIELAVAALGEERIVIGTDYPVQPLERPLEALAKTALPASVRESILSGNAARLLG